VKDYKIKEVLSLMQQSIDSLKEKIEVLIEILEDNRGDKE